MTWNRDWRHHFRDATKSLPAGKPRRLKALLEWHHQEYARLRMDRSRWASTYYHREMIEAIEEELRRRGVRVQRPIDRTELVEPGKLDRAAVAPDWIVELRISIVSAMLARLQRDDDAADLWNEVAFLRAIRVSLEHGEADAWNEFVTFVIERPRLASALLGILESETYVAWRDDRGQIVLVPGYAGDLYFNAVEKLARDAHSVVDREKTAAPDTSRRTRKKRSEIMYIEAKPDITGPARIGRVEFSKTGKTLHYRGRAFRSLKGGYKRNYYDVHSGEEYWISRCHKDGQDTLYPGIIEIDEDVREEYWTKIRERSDLVHLSSFRSNGKYRR